MKYSKQRDCILKTVYTNSNHPSAEMIYKIVKQDLPKISLGTIYRNLNQLCLEGKIKRLSMPDLKDHFDKTIIEHTHLYCTKCQCIYDIFDDSIIENMKNIEKRTNHKINSYSFVCIGTCYKCK